MKTQGIQDFEGLLSEANGKRSREVGIITGGNYVSGTILGKITVGGKYAARESDAADGSEVAVAVLGANVDASEADKTGVIFVRDCEWSKTLLSHHADEDGTAQASAIAELAGKGIIIRKDEDS